jgi:hypothetical protein
MPGQYGRDKSLDGSTYIYRLTEPIFAHFTENAVYKPHRKRSLQTSLETLFTHLSGYALCFDFASCFFTYMRK